MDNSKELTHLSLCTGYGGIDLGLKRVVGPLRTIAYVEIEAFVIQNLVSKIEKGWLDVAPIWTDLKTINWGLFRGRVDILSGGFPCQPFSQAGTRKGSEDPRHLFPYIVKGIKQLGKPPVVFFENVEGIISSKLKGNDWADPEGTPVLLHVLRELERLGYEATAGVFSASEIGAPHQRKRVFILGINNRLSEESRSSILSRFNSNKLKYSLGDSEDNNEFNRRRGDVHEGREIQKGMEVPIGQSGLQNEKRTAYPSSRGIRQKQWEPPRTVANTNSNGRRENREQSNEQGSERSLERSESSRIQKGMVYSYFEGLEGDVSRTFSTGEEKRDVTRSGSREHLLREAESEMGGNSDGNSNWLDFSELYTSSSNRTDELRLLGNGVVPDTCSRAFSVLWKELSNS